MSTFTGTWTCGMCGALVPVGASHYCPEPRGVSWGTPPTWTSSADILADILDELRALRKLLEKEQS